VSRDDHPVLIGDRVLLRDPCVEDVHARLRWTTVDTAWQEWDAPWEGKALTSCDEANRVHHAMPVRWPLPTPREQLWIQTIGGPLVGWVNSYHHAPAERTIWIGIVICESSYWGRGLGTEALRLWMGYQFIARDLASIRTATWAGNGRTVRVAEKCGFHLLTCEPRQRKVRGAWYDGLTFAYTRQAWRNGEGDSENAVQ